MGARAGRQIHPQYDEEYDGKGFAVGGTGCQDLGCAAAGLLGPADVLRHSPQPGGRVLRASTSATWRLMEGAILSAIDVIQAVHERDEHSEAVADMKRLRSLMLSGLVLGAFVTGDRPDDTEPRHPTVLNSTSCSVPPAT